MAFITYLSQQPDVSPPGGELSWLPAWLPMDKVAHFAEFGVLAAFWWLALYMSLRGRSLALAAWGITIAFAMADEFHQGFVPSRTPSAADVIADGLGALAAVIFLGFLSRLAEHWWRRARVASKE